jgi:hypothetical protein
MSNLKTIIGGVKGLASSRGNIRDDFIISLHHIIISKEKAFLEALKLMSGYCDAKKLRGRYSGAAIT